MLAVTVAPTSATRRRGGPPGRATVRVARGPRLGGAPSPFLAPCERRVRPIAPDSATCRAVLASLAAPSVGAPRPLAATLARPRVLREARVPTRAAATAPARAKAKASAPAARSAPVVRAPASDSAPNYAYIPPSCRLLAPRRTAATARKAVPLYPLERSKTRGRASSSAPRARTPRRA